MTDLPGNAYGPLNAWRDPAAPAGQERWLFLPNAPAPQRTPDGTPQVSFVEAGEMTMVALGAVLFPEQAALAQAREAIARNARVEPAAVNLSPATVTVTGATLRVEGEDGTEAIELARAQPSPSPPYQAAFSAMLRGDAAKRVAAARQGQGRIVVRYALDLPETRAAVATLDGDPGSARDVREAIEAGDLKISVEADTGASDALVKETADGALAEAARLFDGIAPPPAVEQFGPADPDTRPRHLHARVRRTEVVPRPLTLEADLADWT